eukprot:875052_1
MTLAQMLEKTIRDVGIAKTTSGGGSIVGGGLALTGAILVPFTAGTSLALTIAGGATMLASGITTLTSNQIKSRTKKSFVDRCSKAYERIQRDARRVAFLLDDYAVTFNVTRSSIPAWKLVRQETPSLRSAWLSQSLVRNGFISSCQSGRCCCGCRRYHTRRCTNCKSSKACTI